MGQQPNIELGISDAPRPKAGPGVARSWHPRRPAELGTPGEVPSGGAFGVIGPDAGYALKLVAQHGMKLLPGENHHDAAVAVAALATARAARLGRAPIADDVMAGLIILGLDGSGSVAPAVLAARPGWIANVGHDAAKLRRLIADVPEDVLRLTPDALAGRVAAGWSLREGAA